MQELEQPYFFHRLMTKFQRRMARPMREVLRTRSRIIMAHPQLGLWPARNLVSRDHVNWVRKTDDGMGYSNFWLDVNIVNGVEYFHSLRKGSLCTHVTLTIITLLRDTGWNEDSYSWQVCVLCISALGLTVTSRLSLTAVAWSGHTGLGTADHCTVHCTAVLCCTPVLSGLLSHCHEYYEILTQLHDQA